MKKTVNINIAGSGFVIDDDAYEMLESYLNTLGEICSKAGEEETAEDIEQRIAEIFTEKLAGHHSILTLADVEHVIDRMGAPEEIVETAPRCEERNGAPNPPEGEQPASPRFGVRFLKKRLYRDLDNRVLGGVCSGLGWYLGIDPVWVRILTVLLALLSGSTLTLIYILLWICIPGARTPYQKMQMMGIDPSVSKIGRVVTEDFNGTRGDYPTSAPARGIRLILAVVCILLTGCFLLVLSAGLVASIVGLSVSSLSAPHYDVRSLRLILGCIGGGSIVAGIPLALAFVALIRKTNGKRMARPNALQLTALILIWLIGLGAVITCSCLL